MFGMTPVLWPACVCVSVTRRYCIETAARIELFFWHIQPYRLPLAYHILYFKDITVSSKIRALPSGTLFRTTDSEKISHGTLTVGERDIIKRQRSSVIYNTWQRRRPWPGWTVRPTDRMLITLSVHQFSVQCTARWSRGSVGDS